MPLNPSWGDIALRLALTILAGAIIGFNRGVRGHAAGLRTTILVGLAASAAMIQANILLSIGGKTPASFGVMDLMRLPLGILTGVGFIGGGTILKRGDLVTGVTTAATLWVMTVIGLCLGGGQLILGIAVTALSGATLFCFAWADRRIPRRQRALIVIKAASARDAAAQLESIAEPIGFAVHLSKQTKANAAAQPQLWFEVNWKSAEVSGPPLDFLEAVERVFIIDQFELTSESRHSAE
jgi:putative Mg2+ transporter-C (MgtC) family protein